MLPLQHFERSVLEKELKIGRARRVAKVTRMGVGCQ